MNGENTAQKKKILHLITGLELGGGAENMLLHLLREIRGNLDNQVCVVRGRGEMGKKLEEAGVPVFYLDLKSVFDLGVIRRYKKILSDFRPDVQVNYLIHADIFGRIFGKIFGVKKIVPYIRNIHRTRKLFLFFDKITLPLVNFVLTNSETAKKFYIQKMGARPEKIKCIPNGIDLEKFKNTDVSSREKKKELGISPEKTVIGCVARLEKQKDVGTLIRAFEKIRKNMPEIHLLLVGHGVEKERLERYCASRNLSEDTTFLEKRVDMPEIYKVMDIFVLPSLQEGMSNAILEAMASSVPAITSDIEENRELIRDGFNGLNFARGDDSDLAEKIETLLKNKTAGQKYAAESLETVKKYDLNSVAKKFCGFLISS